MSRSKSEEDGVFADSVKQRVAEVLKGWGLPYAEFERRFHYSAGYFSKVMRAEKPLTARHLAQVALLTGTHEHWLRTGEAPPGAPGVVLADTHPADRVEEKNDGPYGLAKPQPLRYCPYCGHRLPVGGEDARPAS